MSLEQLRKPQVNAKTFYLTGIVALLTSKVSTGKLHPVIQDNFFSLSLSPRLLPPQMSWTGEWIKEMAKDGQILQAVRKATRTRKKAWSCGCPRARIWSVDMLVWKVIVWAPNCLGIRRFHVSVFPKSVHGRRSLARHGGHAEHQARLLVRGGSHLGVCRGLPTHPRGWHAGEGKGHLLSHSYLVLEGPSIASECWD